MRSAIEAAVGNHSIYKPRRQEFNTGQKVPFRVSPTPFYLSAEQKLELQHIGHDVADYFKAVDEMYIKDIGGIRTILDSGKPQIFLADQPSHYLFIKPDLIITPNGFSVCEIETSPFGLALAEILNRAYQSKGFETMIADGTLPSHIRNNTPTDGSLIYSKKTEAYLGQMTFLADEIFTGDGKNWKAELVDNYETNHQGSVYRGFYLGEYVTDPFIRSLLDRQIKSGNILIPSPTPHMEEKAILTLIYDRRYEGYLRKKLGDASFKHLRAIIPPSWIVGQEEFFSPGMPNNISSSIGLANLSKSKRTFVLKASGFSENSSWKEGVRFLQRESTERSLQLLHDAETDKSRLHVIQQFKKGLNIPMQYEGEDENAQTPMTARVRLTPYYSVAENGQNGELIAIKATGCENTDYIHATSISINTAVN